MFIDMSDDIRVFTIYITVHNFFISSFFKLLFKPYVQIRLVFVSLSGTKMMISIFSAGLKLSN